MPARRRRMATAQLRYASSVAANCPRWRCRGNPPLVSTQNVFKYAPCSSGFSQRFFSSRPSARLHGRFFPAAGAKAVPAFEHDRELYRARIGEIAADEKLGRINAEEAEAAKAEEGRKLLAASTAPAYAPAPISTGLVRLLTGWPPLCWCPPSRCSFILPGGNRSMPDMAIASRTDREPEEQSIEQLVSQAEAQLAKNPGDVRGWTVLAPIYMRLGRFEDNVNAWRNAVRLEPLKSRLQERACGGNDCGRAGHG